MPTPNACPGGLYSPPMNIRSVSIQRPPCVKGAAAQSARLGDCLSQQACTCLFLRKTTPPPLWGTSPYTGEAFSLGIVPCMSLRGCDSSRGSPFSLYEAYHSSKRKGKRIASPVCELVRNDSMVSFRVCHCEAAKQPWQSVLFI